MRRSRSVRIRANRTEPSSRAGARSIFDVWFDVWLDVRFDVQGVLASIALTSVVMSVACSLVACSSLEPPPLDTDDPDTSSASSTSKPTNDASSPPPTDAGPAPATCQTAPPNNRCGLAVQCGCGTNETCDVTNVTTGATSCVTAGNATLGRPCYQTGDCVEGLSCQYGACRPYCSTPLSKCTQPGTDLCVTDLGENPRPNVTICTIACDPRVPDAVCGTNACLWFPTFYAPNKVSDCNFGGIGEELDTCQDDFDCKPGLTCIDHPSSRVGLECERWCRLGQSPSDCKSGFKCKDVFGDNAPVINGVKEGVCQD